MGFKHCQLASTAALHSLPAAKKERRGFIHGAPVLAALSGRNHIKFFKFSI